MPAVFSEIIKLEDKLKKTRLPAELAEKAGGLLERLAITAEAGGNLSDFDNIARYFDWIVALPWYQRVTTIPDIDQVKKILDANHYGLQQVKDRILEYLAVLILKSADTEKLKAPILCFLGLVGTGKTTLGYSIAQSLGRPFWRVPFGGMGGAANLRGQSRAYADSEPGQIIKTLRRVGAGNPVILLDEIDRITEESRADIMGVLVELLDPEQNFAFLDHYIDYPVDLSEVLFVATANNTTNIATAVLDRLEIIQMPSYSDSEKITIGKRYILPKALSDSGLSKDSVQFEEGVWSKLVRPLGFDPGMRSLERTIYGICRKVARATLEKKVKTVKVDSANLSQLLPSW